MKRAAMLILATLVAATIIAGCGRDLFTERQSDGGLSRILRDYGPK